MSTVMDDNFIATARRRGQCETCGTKTHNVYLFGSIRIPLTRYDHDVVSGRCLHCHPLQGYVFEPLLVPPAQHDSVCTQCLGTIRKESGYKDTTYDDDIMLCSCSTNDCFWDPSPLWNFPMKKNKLSCCICASDPIQPSEAAGIDGCRHMFCFTCIDQWSSYENTCPLCKGRFHKIVPLVEKKNSPAKMVKFRNQREERTPHGRRRLEDAATNVLASQVPVDSPEGRHTGMTRTRRYDNLSSGNVRDHRETIEGRAFTPRSERSRERISGADSVRRRRHRMFSSGYDSRTRIRNVVIPDDDYPFDHQQGTNNLPLTTMLRLQQLERVESFSGLSDSVRNISFLGERDADSLDDWDSSNSSPGYRGENDSWSSQESDTSRGHFVVEQSGRQAPPSPRNSVQRGSFSFDLATAQGESDRAGRRQNPPSPRFVGENGASTSARTSNPETRQARHHRIHSA